MTSPVPGPDPAVVPEPAARRRLRHGGWIVASLLALVLLLVAGFVAVGADGDGDDHDARARDRALVAGTSITSSITPERASEIALHAAGGGRVTDVDLDDHVGVLVYEVEVQGAAAPPASEVDVVVDARSGAVLSVAPDHD